MRLLLRRFAVVVICLGVARVAPGQAPPRAEPGSSGVAAALRPFVEDGTLAGAVDAGRVAGEGARRRGGRLGGYCREEADAHGRGVLDRVAVEADHRGGTDDPRRRGEGEGRRPGRDLSAGVQGPVGRRGKGRGPRAAEASATPDPRARGAQPHERLPFSSPIEKPTLDLFPLELRVRSSAMRRCSSSAGLEVAILERPGSIPRGGSSRSSPGCLIETFLDERLFKPLGMKGHPPGSRDDLSALGRRIRADGRGGGPG